MAESDGPDQVARPAVIPDRSMIVLYGSEMGNAEDIAIEIGQLTQRLHFQTTVDEMDNFKLSDLLRASLVIFVTSTTGQGDMPKNTLKFWKNLRREKLNNTNCLGSLRFAIFGLGDSSYQKFNWAARKLQVRLLQLGASEFFRAGEADERHDNGIDSIYLPWYQDLRAALLSDFPLPDSVTPIPDDIQLPPKYLVKLSSPVMGLPALSARRSHVDRAPSAEERIQEDIERKSPKFPGWFARENEAWETINKRSVDTLDKDNILKDYPDKYLLEKSDDVSEPVKPFVDELKVPGGYTAYLSDYTRVTPKDHWQDVRLLRFEFYGELERLNAIQDWGGQLNLTIYPKNSQDDVEELISMMGWQSVADTPLEIPVMPKRLHLAGGEDATTIRTLLFHSLDFTAIPKRNFIRELAHFTDIELEKERLRELTDSVNIQEYYDYACRPRRTILELLRDFPGVKIPHERILDLFQPIRGREFSVASGGASLRGKTAQSDDDDDVVDCCLRMEILVAMVEYKTIIRKPRQGLCSRYIKTLKPGSFLTVSVESSSLPRLVSHLWSRRPMIAVATGTGIAPIRALVQERSNWPSPGDTLIFYGCRNRAADYYFENEWKQHSNVAIFPAFSRDKDQISPRPAATTVKANDWLTARIPDQTFKVDKPQYDDNKNYVQHLIRQKAETVLHFLKQGPIVCVCGNAGRMPVSVRNAFLDVLVSTGHCENKEAAARWFDNPKNLTFWQECW